MPRMTAKYKGALGVAKWHEIPTEGNQEDLYQRLQEAGWFWNSQAKAWEEYDIADADEPSPLVMVRVWADAEIVEDAADDITRRVKALKWQLVEKSRPYACRPPKQREARVYLKFLPQRS